MRADDLTFVDPGALVAVLDRTDARHNLLGNLWLLELEVGTTLVTTASAALQASRQLQDRYGPEGPRVLLEAVLPAMRVEWCGPGDFSLAVAAFLASPQRAKDLADCLDEQVKRRLRVRHVLGG